MGLQKNYSEDDIIIKEGSNSPFLFLITSGHVAIYLNYGKEDEYLLGLYGKNHVIGETSALSGEANYYTAVAFSDVEVVCFSEKEFMAFIRNYPDQALGLIKSLSSINNILRVNCEMLINELQHNVQNGSAARTKILHDLSMADSFKESTLSTEESNPSIAKWNSTKN